MSYSIMFFYKASEPVLRPRPMSLVQTIENAQTLVDKDSEIDYALVLNEAGDTVATIMKKKRD